MKGDPVGLPFIILIVPFVIMRWFNVAQWSIFEGMKLAKEIELKRQLTLKTEMNKKQVELLDEYRKIIKRQDIIIEQQRKTISKYANKTTN